jgi:hypothetical protein
MKAKQLMSQGINKATESANLANENWSNRAFNFLRKYTLANKEFMTEDVRNASLDSLEEPPSARAWGGVMLRAKHSGLIEKKGTRNTKNPKSHCTPASLWVVKI